MPAERAHVLVQVDPGRSGEAVRFLSSLPAVVEAVMTSGSYDVIVTVDAASEGVLRHVLAQARRTPGLAALRLCRAAS